VIFTQKLEGSENKPCYSNQRLRGPEVTFEGLREASWLDGLHDEKVVGGETRELEVSVSQCYIKDTGFCEMFNKHWVKKGKNKGKQGNKGLQSSWNWFGCKQESAQWTQKYCQGV
jgi:hypothetical protein